MKQSKLLDIDRGLGQNQIRFHVRPRSTLVGGNFKWGRFLFQIENGGNLIGLREELYEDDFDLRLTSCGCVPDLNGAPIASWALARLRRLTDDGFPEADKQVNDGGGYSEHFVVYVEAEKAIAAFQFQGNMEGLAIIGDRAADCPADELLMVFAEAMLAEPDTMMPCRYTIIDPEWKHDPEMYTPTPIKGSSNRYGWDGIKFLGRKNIREK